MDRNNLFSRPAHRGGGGGPGLPGRQVQRPPGDAGGYPPAPGGYDSYGGRPPAPARPQYPSGGGAGYEARQSQPRGGGRQVRLRLAKVEDKTLQAQYIFGNV
ncbi:predicted protein [Chaetomium globosum CBS 148.51]|uniref:Uncharacterized protein n=1 Tax=Chaetomium globosum (strain ATCC 6205 / CBS 148.51 / DSM 1962 / NBRC 6347 / NRRL 1970) TaxID=306901 RepID=Q2GV71_CHAGB|nr:uncharacterized protein CHGG_08133 [Chaetomium globosum CBS 148.51]EAQ86880.1 predicted protein [Chaetomium globosum CBS 148.51]